jgi:hypothetical protein
LEIEVYNEFEQCEKAWNAIVPAACCLNNAELLVIEKAKLDNITPCYVIIKKANEIIGVCYFQQFKFTKQHVAKGNNFFTKCVVSYLPFKIPILVCGNLFRINFPGYYFVDSKNNGLVFEVIDSLLKQSKKCTAVLIKDCTQLFDGRLTQKNGFQFFDGDVTMELQNQGWQSFDDYQAALQKKYLQRAKKILKQFEPVVVKQFSLQDLDTYKHELMQLYQNILAQQSIKLGIINIDYLRELQQQLQNNFELHGMFINEKLVGFYTYIFYEKTMETHFIGLDYEANKKYNLYFNILFASVKTMIDRKLESLELGRTAREAKANLGAQPQQIYNYMKITSRFTQRLFTIFQKRFNVQENYKSVERNPFK